MTGNAITAARLTMDAWRHDHVPDLLRLKRILADLEPEELRGAVEHLARLVASLGAVLEESAPDFVFDRWITDKALVDAAREVAT